MHPRTISDLAGTKQTAFRIGTAYTAPTLDSHAAPKKYVDDQTYRLAFDDSDLGEGDLLTVEHNFGTKFVLVQLYDNNDLMIGMVPITAHTINQILVDLSSMAPISGTWNIMVKK